MVKNNKLYTVNRWNLPLFSQDNVFAPGGQLLAFDKLASQEYGADYGEAGKTLNDYMNSKNAFGISKADNPFSKGNLMSTFSKENLIKNVSGIGAAVGAGAKKIISGGLNSGAGNGVSAVGSAAGSLIGKVNPVLGGVVSAASGIIGGGINAAVGTGVDQAKKQANEAGTAKLSSFNSSASSFDDIQGPQAVNAVQNAYKSGFLNKGWARKRNAQVKQDRLDAYNHAYSSVENNIDNIANTQMDNMLANYAAFGGPLGITSSGNGALNYDFMSNYLLTKDKSVAVKDKMSNNMFGTLASSPEPTLFAIGGDIQSNGADWSTGLSHIDAGGSHEANPYQGVQMGISSENGQPNLVEEGETIFDDYVYSRRIRMDKEAKKKFHIGKKRDITYADMSKKLEKESLERPNDAISQQGLRKQMHDLAEEQERQKQEEQAKQAIDAFESLPPEQQAEIMQQLAMQEQQAQQAAMQQQATQQQGMQGQPMEQQEVDTQIQPNEQQTVEQQQMEQQATQEPMQEGAQMNACGGKINRYDDGGNLKRAIYKVLGLYTDSDFNKWAKDRKLDKITDWENILKNQDFMKALNGVNPILSDVISRGYDFGNYKYTPSDTMTFDFLNGGWGAEDYNAWRGSSDKAWIEALEKGLVKEGMTSEEIGNALKQTEAYQRGTKMLQDNEDIRLKYLNAIYNSKDAPQAARDFAAKFVDGKGWNKDAVRDYNSIFGEVRNTHPGTFWKTPEELLRSSSNINYVRNADGSIEEIIGDVPKEWKNVGSYAWQTATGDNTANYYERPEIASTDDNKNGNKQIKPIYKPIWGRTAGLLGPAVGLGMQALGIGKPNYSRMDTALDTARQAPVLAHAQTIGNYLAYNPMDIWYEQNRMNANSRATDRAIMNNASPLGTKMAGLLANGYNSQIASGDLYRKALEYNDAKQMAVEDFNRKTNMYNADALTKISATNAEMMNRDKQFQAQYGMSDAQQRMAADAAWNQGIYGNVNAMFKGLGDWGKENVQHNMIADMAANGLFGTISGDKNKQPVFGKYVTTAAKGGKIRRKKGLTF